MKKLINLFALVLCFSFLATTAADAQNMFKNATNCAFTVTVEFADLSISCAPTGTVTFSIPAMTATAIPIFDFQSPVKVYGSYTGVGFDACFFYVEAPCQGTQQNNNVTCPLLCGNYSASLNISLGNVAVF